MEIWHIWILVGLVLFIAEIFTSGFVLACLGVGCLASGFVSFIDMDLKIQIITFSLTSLVVFFLIRPIFLKYFYSGVKLKTNVEALVGRRGQVTERIDPKEHKGRVIVNGEDWRGISIDETVIEKGEKIEVVEVEGTKLLVQKEVSPRKED